MRVWRCDRTAGVVHVSCLAEQAKVLVAEAERIILDDKVLNERWARWYSAVCASNGIMAPCYVRWGGRAGRRMLGGRRPHGRALQ